MADDKVIEQIAKLKAHAESAKAIGSDKEAQAFAEMMQRLLAKHKLSMTDIEFMQYQDKNPIGNYPIDYAKYPDIELYSARQAWIERLAGIVGRAHNCRYAYYTKSSRISLIGRKHEAEQCEFVLIVLQRYVEAASDRARHEYYHAHVAQWKREGRHVAGQMKGYRDNWISAFVSRLAQRYDEEKRRLEREAAAACVALVRVSDLKAVDDWVEAGKTSGMFEKKSHALGPVARTAHADGQRHGAAAADEVNLRSNAVEGNETKQLVRAPLTHDWQRTRVVHGWAFRTHTTAEVVAIRKFLETGAYDDLPESYRELFDVVATQKK